MNTPNINAEGAPTKELPGSDSLIGVDGNAYAIMAKVARDLHRAGASAKYVDGYRADATSGDYDNLLSVSCQYLDQ